jgi:hypothetical protein
MAVLGEKLGGGPMNHLAELGVVSGALFLGSSRVHPTLLVTCERLPCTGTAHRKRTSGVRVVLVGSSPVGCTSIRITVTLGYE